MTQLGFRWPAPSTYAPDDFIVSEANQAAVRFIDGWPSGREPSALLTGPAASGKTHLAHRWALRVRAEFLEVKKLGNLPSEALWKGSNFAVLENAEALTDEASFFHLLRHAETSGMHLLITSRVSAAQLPFHLPDIRSRLLAMPSAAISEPDETLLHAFLTKAFADRQWRVSGQVTRFLAMRMERSFDAAQTLLQKLEQLVLTTHRELTIPLVKPLVE